MNDGYAWWLVIVGIAIGIALAWLVAGRLRRHDDDVDEDERIAEADWISRTLASTGTNAPVPLVEQVLELHATYLESGTALNPPSTGVAEPAEEQGTWAPRPGTDQPGTRSTSGSDSADRSFTPSPPG
jgi:hypothetical protein